MGKFCPQCGASVTEEGKFCSSCGAKLAESSQPEQVQSQVNLSKQDTPSAEQNNSVQNSALEQNNFTQSSAPEPNDFFVEDNSIEEMFLKRTGRLNRLRFFKRSLALGLTEFVLFIIIIIMFGDNWGNLSTFGNLLFSAVVFLGLIPDYCLMVRRLHDLNKDDTLAKITVGIYVFSLIYSLTEDPLEFSAVDSVIGIVQFAIALYFCLTPGVKGRNQYGPDPLG